MLSSLTELQLLLEDLFLLSHTLCRALRLSFRAFTIIKEKCAGEVAHAFSTDFLCHKWRIETFMGLEQIVTRISVIVIINNLCLQAQSERHSISLDPLTDISRHFLPSASHLWTALASALFEATGHSELGFADHGSIRKLRIRSHEIVSLQLQLRLLCCESDFLNSIDWLHG